jgi:sugar lactone lactonase YvrE
LNNDCIQKNAAEEPDILFLFAVISGQSWYGGMEMSVCAQCGKENEDQAPFCSNCKASLVEKSPESPDSEPGRPFRSATLILIGIIVLFGTYLYYSHFAWHGVITSVAGNGTQGYAGDSGPATGAELNYPIGVAFDASGNLYIADAENNRVCKVDRAGVITTVAGNGAPGYNGDPGPAIWAELNYPMGLAVDTAGNLYIADTQNNRVRKVDRDGVITTVAGTGAQGYSSDGPAVSAELNQPTDVAVDSAGNIYIADNQNFCIRRVDADGVITTVAGNGTQGYGGDGGPATGAELDYPTGVAVDSFGALYITDARNNRIRKVDRNGIITTVAGNGTQGYGGDGGLATSAELNYPAGMAFDASGDLYLTDEGNSRIRRVDANGVITTVAGNGTQGYGGDGGPATGAELNFPADLAFDASGNLYIADIKNNRIRKVERAAAGIRASNR